MTREQMIDEALKRAIPNDRDRLPFMHDLLLRRRWRTKHNVWVQLFRAEFHQVETELSIP